MENIAATEQYFRFSKYCYPYQRDGVLAVFHALNVNVAYLARHNNVVADHLINRRNFLLSELAPDEREIAEDLLGIGMVIPEQEDEEVILEKIRTEQTGTPAIGILYLLLTETCNLACTYCFIEGAIPPGYAFTRMSPETAEAAIDLFARTLNPNNRPSIIFYGGEPLVNWKTLAHAVLYIETKIIDGILPDNTEISIITNATLLTDSRIKFFKEHNIGVSISLDGPASNNDARIFHNHRKSIDSVMRAYHKLRQNGMSFGISCTLSSHNVANIEAITQWFCDEKVDAVGFNILMDIPGSPANPS
jgi:uncharacterized protein